jgi:hypothetical protein
MFRALLAHHHETLHECIFGDLCAVVDVETFNLNKVIEKVKRVSRWLCLLRNYVTMMHGQQHIKFIYIYI